MTERKVIYLDDAINALESKKDKKAKGDIGGFYNFIIQKDINALMQLPSAQPKAIRPKFVAEDRYRKNYFQMFPHCPKCNYELETGDCYCRVCGCHIDWDEDDETN